MHVVKIGIGGVVVSVMALGVAAVVNQREPPPLQTPEALEQQAATITAHRQSQREGTPFPAPGPSVPAEPASAPAVPPRSTSIYWTDFRGPQRDGVYRERPIRAVWPASGLTPLWQQPVGGGHASFVVARGHAFTIEQRGSREVVAAYEVATGRELWTNAWLATFNEHYGGAGPRATPTWHDGAVYALGATGELRALEAATGAVRWRTNILEDADARNLEWGMSVSPLVVRNTVVVFPGGSNGSLVGYDRATGKRAWSVLDDGAAYSSPAVATVAGVEQILVVTASRVVGVSPDGARVFWEFPWPTRSGINAAQPLVIGTNRVFLSAGYGMGALMLEISRDGDRLSAREVWRTNRMKNTFTTSVYHDGFIYGLDEAILACIDAATGELKWKGGRYGHGQVMLASGHLIVVTETGDLALVRATAERHDESARFPALTGRTWNHPAIADGILLVRNTREMAAYDLRLP
jgi:outer membrane protein assembly factor BamB